MLYKKIFFLVLIFLSFSLIFLSFSYKEELSQCELESRLAHDTAEAKHIEVVRLQQELAVVQEENSLLKLKIDTLETILSH